MITARLLAVCCVALLATGAAGAVGLAPKAAKRPALVATATTIPSPAGGASPGAMTAVSPPAGSAVLAAGLIQPADMGGYYRPSPGALDGLVDSDPCLATLQPSPAQGGRAAEGLVTADSYQVPQIVEIVASYAGTTPMSVYDSTVAAIKACAHFAFAFDGTDVSGSLGPEPLATSADESTAWRVPFEYEGQGCDLQMALVRQGQNVLFLAWIDTVAPSPAIMGNFASTVPLAIGEEA
jgi:hypothetical protein